jgi:hypothetical protein
MSQNKPFNLIFFILAPTMSPEKPNNFTENLIPKRVKLDDKYRGGKKMSRKRTVYSAEF